MEKRIRSLILFFLMSAVCASSGEKPQPAWKSFNDGVAEAKQSGKKILIDVYTDWCGWCKKMDKDTYTDQQVSDYLSRKYVAIKLNAESSRTLRYKGNQYTEQELAQAFGINGYPSIIFLTQDGEPITIYPGYADANLFRTVLSYIAEDQYKTIKFEEYTKHR